ncbi:MAG TPA: sulfotransferase family protein [Cryomorphaceae bacterium]|jgi:hypothetical protein|nr:MAG: hypothetical protein ABR88_05140 [Cryomorphaceae bacterium BACL7 MAG-120322-bin74]KRO83277.1 MAG: hypothetical protein ABR87_00790 [Cryomorphaceae bacterium BACL7 MAG-121220-bin83]NQW25709.1 HAD family hydrolase [Cryomorphaceae bacterium]HAB31047.1 sulfotransferase family protein [Cryomorphaceae bacterium]
MPRILHAISGPRNISTALMYAFAQRPGCSVVDEPFYGPFLMRTGLDHPGRTETLAVVPNTANEAIADLHQRWQENKEEWYLKNMAHHMVDMPWDWAHEAAHIFWIRHPRKVIRSFSKVWPDVTLADIGIEEQVAQWEAIQHFHGPKIVVDSDEMLTDPAKTFPKICAALGIPFYTEMLQWNPGPKPYDGPWWPHWYANVHASTGFGKPSPLGEVLEGRYADLEAYALPFYETLYPQRLKL